VVTLEELGIIIPLLTAIVIPIVIIMLTRHLKGSDTLTRSSIITDSAIDKIEEYIVSHKIETKETITRLEELEKSVYNMCWRIDKIEKEHEAKRF
jgi:hypothetical protein